MEFQVKMTNNHGSLYFGHPFSRETYTNSCQLKTPVSEWEFDVDGIYSGKKCELRPIDYPDYLLESCELEERFIRGTKCCFIGDYSKVQEMEEDVGVYHALVSKATIRANNPDYLDFAAYTEAVLHDPMQNVEDLKTITPDQAKKYMEYAVLYDKDTKYSDRLITKAYFTSTDSGVLILAGDFIDFNLNLKIDPEQGVVGATVWISENTSHYLKQYKEI